MGELTKLPNIGSAVEDQLNQVGIHTFEELQATGSKQSWLKIKSIDDSACYNRLCALEGAILGIKKFDLSEDKKAELKEFYNTFK